GLAKMTTAELLEYPREMFLTNEDGNRLHGFYFWAALPCVVLTLVRRERAAVPVAWLIVLFLMLEFMPQKVAFDAWYTQGHYFRYLAILVMPTCLILAHRVDRCLAWRPRLAMAGFVGFVGLSLLHGWTVTYPTRDCFDDLRRAVTALLAQKPAVTYADVGMRNWTVRFGGVDADPSRIVELPEGAPAKRRATYEGMPTGYVVTGGGRMPYYYPLSTTANLTGVFTPPERWKLVWTLDKPVERWRMEPIRIWRVEEE